MDLPSDKRTQKRKISRVVFIGEDTAPPVFWGWGEGGQQYRHYRVSRVVLAGMDGSERLRSAPIYRTRKRTLG